MSTRSSRHYTLDERPTLVFVNASALRIVSLAAPCLTPARLWALKMLDQGPGEQRPISDVEYGPVWAGGMYVTLRQMEDDDKVDQWMLQFMRSGVVREEDRTEMMMGMGRQWVFVRPDRFPVTQAFAYRSQLPNVAAHLELSALDLGLPSLPVDILLHIASFLSLSCLLKFSSLTRSMLSALGPFLDSLTHSLLIRDSPWLLPPDDGGPEKIWWDSHCQVFMGGQETPFPWIGYARACWESPSMKNRRRLWGIAEQLEVLAERRGLMQST